jgi:hypothetical protein
MAKPLGESPQNMFFLFVLVVFPNDGLKEALIDCEALKYDTP